MSCGNPESFEAAARTTGGARPPARIRARYNIPERRLGAPRRTAGNHGPAAHRPDRDSFPRAVRDVACRIPGCADPGRAVGDRPARPPTAGSRAARRPGPLTGPVAGPSGV
jgi:hypothetical protein